MANKNKILVIDDTMEIRILIKIRMEMSGFDVIEAENGKLGIESARKNNPDLIITDYSMPVMNGMDVARTLKSDPATSHIPLIMLSSFPFGKDMIDEFKIIRIDAYMMKPYEYENLFEKITELLKLNSNKNVINLMPLSENSAHKEKRACSRFNTFTHASVEINGINYLARIKNISRHGLSLVLPQNTQIGTTLKIKFIKGASDFVGQAKVIWIDKDPVDNQFLAGVEMESVAV
jgi:response regulator RpfG family c-di-GMP phosphodiesterase